MLGPFKIIGPFFKVTKGADARLTRQIAVWATIFSALALLIAGFLGENILSNYGIPLPVLALSGGIILFLVALKNVLEQFEAAEPHTDDVAVPPAAAIKVAMSPLAFPTIVTPYGIAAVVVLVAFGQTLESRLTVGAVVVGIMVLNLIVMLVARRLQTVLAVVLPISAPFSASSRWRWDCRSSTARCGSSGCCEGAGAGGSRWRRFKPKYPPAPARHPRRN